MDELLHQLEPLLLGSVPTMLLFIFLVIAYRFLVFGPLRRTLNERRERTLGAVEKAKAAIAAADAKTQEYEAKLRAARAEIFRAREQKVRQWNAERDSALEAARQHARERVNVAKSDLQAQAEAARHTIERSANDLVADVLRSVLPSEYAPAEVTR